MKPVDFNIIIFQEDDLYTGDCPEFGLYACADTPEQVKEMLIKEARSFVNEAEKAGNLKDILDEAGYRLRDGRWTPPKLVSCGIGSAG